MSIYSSRNALTSSLYYSEVMPIENHDALNFTVEGRFDLVQKNLEELNDAEVNQVFNSLIINGNTLLQNIASRGEFDLAQKIIERIPKDEVLLAGKSVYKDEMSDCLIKTDPLDLSSFDRTSTLVAQNGCRAVVLTEEGGAYAYPGYSAAKIAESVIGNSSDVDYLKVYHNSDHASVSFSDGMHLGSYPSVALFHGTNEFRRTSSRAFWTHFPQPPSFYTDQVYQFISTFPRTPPLVVKDDSSESSSSSKTNELMLKIYGPTHKIEQMQQYAVDTAANSKSEDNDMEPYDFWYNNCVKFVRNTIQASGTQADFRDAFFTSQFLRRPGKANLYSAIQTTGPTIIQTPSNIEDPSLAQVVDAVSRDHLRYAVLIGTVLFLKKIASCFRSCFFD